MNISSSCDYHSVPKERVIRAAVPKPEGEVVRYQCGPAVKYLALYKDGVAKEEEMDSVFTKPVKPQDKV